MIARLLFIAATLILATTPGRAQVPPPECSELSTPNARRLALLITDPDGIPFSGIGHVSVRGTGRATPRPDDQRPAMLEPWYCTDELPRGAYTVEVETLTFACTAISLPESEPGLIVRLIRLRPDPWLAAGSRRYGFMPAFDPQVALVGQLGSRHCGPFVG